MPVTLRKEDGTGVARANTFVAVSDVDDYAADRGLASWTDFTGTEEEKKAALVRAGDYLKNETRFVYRGTKKTSAQGLPWPRTGASEYRGPSIPDTEIPWRLQDAQCELAIRALVGQDLQPDLERGGQVQTSTVDVITTTWFEGASAETTITAVLGLLAPLLRTKVTDIAAFYATPEDRSPFVPGEFDYPKD